MNKKFLYYLAWTFIALGLLITGFYLYELKGANWELFGSGKIDIEKTGQFGDYIGGFIGTIISVSGFIFLYLTLKEQREAFGKERFETKFFELLQIQRANVAEMSITIDGSFSKRTILARDVIKKIVEEVLESREEMKMFFRRRTESDIYVDEYSKTLKDNLQYTNPNVNLVKLAKVNIAYCVVFYGVDAEGKRALERLFRGKYKLSFYNPIINYVSLKPSKDHLYYQKWSEINQINPTSIRKKIAAGILSRRRTDFKEELYSTKERVKIENLWYRNEFEKYYSGYQTILGHYFRHLFQTVSFIHKEKSLKKGERYFFMKTLRAQLSTHEQVLIFINSLSFMGMPWELVPSFVWTEKVDAYKKLLVKDSMFITNYKLIKNIPNENHFGYNIHDFYPNLIIEASEQDSNIEQKRKNLSYIALIKQVYDYYKKLIKMNKNL